MNTTETKYFIFPAGKPEEQFEVIPHTFGDEDKDGICDVSFADAKLANTDGWDNPEIMYTWANGDKDGAFVNNDVEQLDVTNTWDIVKQIVEIQNAEVGAIAE